MNHRVDRLRSRWSAGVVLGALESLPLAIAALAIVPFAVLLSCSSGSDAEDGSSAQPAPVQPEQDAPAVDEAADGFGRYQFVDTPDGMTVETVRADGVFTLSCPVRSCAGLCDECAAAACEAAGELETACAALVNRCSDSCNCETGGLGCGFPVCALDRQVCYIGGEQGLEGAVPGAGPAGPGPDPSPEASAARPAGGEASTPTPVP